MKKVVGSLMEKKNIV